MSEPRGRNRPIGKRANSARSADSPSSEPPAGEGRSPEFDAGRVAAFSDAVMAIAITLLILDLRLPGTVAQTDAALQDQLRALEAPFVAFLLSFAVIAVWWNSHHRLFGALRRGDRRILLLNFVFLAAVAFLPFPTSVLGRSSALATAIVLYAATNFVIGAAVLLMWWHATRSGLLGEDLDARQLRHFMAYAAMAPLMFLASIPVALVRPDLAPWSWNAIWIAAAAMRLWWRREDARERRQSR